MIVVGRRHSSIYVTNDQRFPPPTNIKVYLSTFKPLQKLFEKVEQCCTALLLYSPVYKQRCYYEGLRLINCIDTKVPVSSSFVDKFLWIVGQNFHG